MQNYPTNSPQLMARIICLCLMADSEIDPSELSELKPSLYAAIGLNQTEFTQVLQQYLHDIVNESEHGRINLLELKRVDELLDSVTGRSERINTLVTALRICKSDNALNNAELALFSHIMQKWQIDLTDLEIEACFNS